MTMTQQQAFTSNHFRDPIGNPAGGVTYGRGFTITWQRGPLLDANGNRIEPNGAFVEDIIKAAMDRIGYYQATRFASQHNIDAIGALSQALGHLTARTAEREARGVEGTHEA